MNETPNKSDTNSGPLPRGLITRRGSSRLPSLRGDSHSASLQMMGSTAAPITTKGGALKRTFKPTIPQRRNPNEDNSLDVKPPNDNHSHSRRGRPPKTPHNNNRSKAHDSKNWVQTEGAVFRGEDNPALRSSRMREESSTTRQRLSNGTDVRIKSDDKSEDRFDGKNSKAKLENKAKILCKLYGDNFIDDSDTHASDRHLLFPKGWHTVNSRQQSSYASPAVEPLNPYNLFKTESQEKLVLMQISEEFLKRGNGYIGKMRVYKSGRIELHDTESDMKFDVLFDRNTNLTNFVKQENGSQSTKQNSDNTFDVITEDVVTFSDNTLCVLSGIAHKEVLLAVPQLPDQDSHHS